MITSTGNPQVKHIVQLNQKARLRREEGLFTAEGVKMFLEAPAGWLEKVYLTEALKAKKEITKKLTEESIIYETVTEEVFAKMSDTRTPQGVLALLRTPAYRPEDLFHGEDDLLVVLEDLQDPGNAGTILRCGEGAGISGLILTRGSVDMTSPKVIRATMGSIYRVPFLYADNIREVKDLLKSRGVRSYAAHLGGKRDYDEESYTGGTAFWIGNEGNGLTEEAAAAADSLIRIPMKGRVESLNAAMAAGILMYEAARQKRRKG